ncbi:MAG: acyl-CoA dehydrogenase family protein [Jatrophihabitans sp.]
MPDLAGPGVDPVAFNTVRRIVATEVSTRAARIDETSEFPHDSYQALAAADVAGLLIPTRWGGQDTNTVTYAAAMEDISAACGSTSTVYMTQMHCAHPIQLVGTDEQRERFIPSLCRGESYGAIAVSEPAAGSDVSSIATVARRDGDAYLLSGQKIFISNGDRADVVVLFATLDRGRGRHGITAFLVERGTAGFSTGRPMHKLGQRGASTAELFLSDCRVPVVNRLGAEGEGYPLSIRSVMKSRISAAAQGVGFARGAYERTAARLGAKGLLSSSRRDAQDLQFVLAGMRARIAAARAMLHATAALVESSEGDPAAEVAMAKLHCTDLGVEVAAEAIELLGEDGDRVDLGVERMLRDAKATQIYDGTNQVQRMLIARDIRQRYTANP